MSEKDKKEKKAAKLAAPWNPEWGFCKGLAKHSYAKKTVLFTATGTNGKSAGFVGEFKCINCPTTRRSVFVRGEAAVHTYVHPPGYKGQPAGDDGHMLPTRTIRDNYIRENVNTKKKS